jgi:hypothetical protein
VGTSWAASLLGLSLVVSVSCREPTELTLTIHTSLPCADTEHWKGVAVYVGKSGHDVESTSATLVTQTCDSSGNVGSLVVVPSKAKDGVFGLRVVAGITRNPEDCAAADYEGCVVARRIVRFSPHASLELDVDLAAECINQGCTSGSTCQTGDCIDIKDLPPPESAPAPAPSSNVQPGDASVRCGDNGVFCGTSGDVCCLSVDVAAGTTLGDCRPAKDCPPSSIVLNCDDDTDCPAREEGTNAAGLCALSYTHAGDNDWFVPDYIALSECRFAHSHSVGDTVGLGLCEDRKSCGGGQFPCRPSSARNPQNQLPGYFWCQLTVP